MIEPTITITLSDYNKLIDAHSDRCTLPQKVFVKNKVSRIRYLAKRMMYSILCYKRNIGQQRLIKRSISCAIDDMYMDIIGYWHGDISEYMREHLKGHLKVYKQDAYFKIMKELNV